MTSFQHSIERAEAELMDKCFCTDAALNDITSSECKCDRELIKPFLRETIRKAVEEAFSATMPVPIEHDECDCRYGPDSHMGFSKCLDDLRTRQKEFLEADTRG